MEGATLRRLPDISAGARFHQRRRRARGLGRGRAHQRSRRVGLQADVRRAVCRQRFVSGLAAVEPVGLCPARPVPDECFAPDCLPGRPIESPAV